MNTLLNKLLGVTIICFLILMGCDSSQVVEDSIPKISKPFVFNPSVKLIAIDPGSFVRVTDQQQNITISQKFWIGTHEITQSKFESLMGNNPSFFKGENLPVDKVTFEKAVSFCKALTLNDLKAVSYTHLTLPTKRIV